MFLGVTSTDKKWNSVMDKTKFPLLHVEVKEVKNKCIWNNTFNNINCIYRKIFYLSCLELLEVNIIY